MAELTLFGYRAGTSFLHRIDPRFKIAGLALLGLSSLGLPKPILTVVVLVLQWALQKAGISPLRWIRDLGSVWVLLLFVLIARAMSAASGTPPLEGFSEGGWMCLRLFAALQAAAVLSATTSPSQIEAAARILLKPVPLVPEARVATMLGLVVRLVPEILYGARQTGEALKARGVERRKNPVVRLGLFALPMMRRAFQHADRLALAMEARCYSEERTAPELTAGPGDWFFAGVIVAACLSSFL